MKNLKKAILIIAISLVSFVTNNLTAMPKNATAPKAQSEISAEQTSSILNKRILEIQAMDKSKLSAKEKSILKSELKRMKAQVHSARNGIYISTGAVLLIILIIILL
jgi:hypothetical protein